MAGPVARRGEYAARGDYHRALDPEWEYAPTYRAKLEWVRGHLDNLPSGTRVLDAGCGEGVLIDEFSSRLAIEGIDPNYSAPLIQTGTLSQLPYRDDAFDVVLCLDVLEHLTFAEQTAAISEIRRVLRPSGELLVSVPNLAHLQSRVHFLLTGRLIRTSHERKHPGDRPVGEYLRMLTQAGFELRERQGIFPTVPVLTRLIRHYPSALAPVHRLLTRILPVPGWCFLNLLRFSASEKA
jgi:SAM-dependent methyltransferase